MFFPCLCLTLILQDICVSGLSKVHTGGNQVAPSGKSLNVAIATCEAIAQDGQISARSSATAVASGLGPVLAQSFCFAMVEADGSTAEASAFSLARATSMFTGTALSVAASQALSNSVGPQIAQAVGSALAQMGSSNAKAFSQALVQLCTQSSTGGSNRQKFALAIARCEAIAQSGQGFAAAEATAIVQGLGADLAIAVCSAFAEARQSTAQKAASSLLKICTQPKLRGSAFSQAASSAFANVVDQGTAQAAASAFAQAGRNRALAAAEAFALASGVSPATTKSQSQKFNLAIARCEAIAQSGQGFAAAEATTIVQTLGANLAIAVCSAFAEVRQNIAQKTATALLKICTQPKLQGSAFSQAASSAFANVVDKGTAQAAASAFAQAGSTQALAAAEALALASGVSLATKKPQSQSQLSIPGSQARLSAASALAEASAFARAQLRKQQASASAFSQSSALTQGPQVLMKPEISIFGFQTGPTSASSQTSALSTLVLPGSTVSKPSSGLQILFPTNMGSGSSIGLQTLPTSALSRSSALSIGSQSVLPTFVQSQSSALSQILPGVQRQMSKRAIAVARCFAIAQTQSGFAVARAKATAIVNALNPDLAIAICSAFAGVPRNVAQTAAYSLVKLTKSPLQSVALSQAVSNVLSAVMQPSTALAVARAFASASSTDAIAAAEALAVALGVSSSATAQSSAFTSGIPVTIFSNQFLPQALPKQAFARANAFAQSSTRGSRLVNRRGGKTY